jgi:hypothetical protein
LIDNGVSIPPDLLMGLNTIGAFKTYDYYLQTLTRLVQTLYVGAIGGEFIGIMDNLILGQISNAYENAWIDSGLELPPDNYIRDASQAMVIEQRGFVQGYYQAIVDAKIDQTPIDPLLQRASLWANQWNTAYNDGTRLIASNMGNKLVWREGGTIDKCPTCLALNGIVAFATEWDQSGFRPQSAPNNLLECQGWHCLCSLEVTEKRRSPNALSRLLDIATSRNV